MTKQRAEGNKEPSNCDLCAKDLTCGGDCLENNYYDRTSCCTLFSHEFQIFSDLIYILQCFAPGQRLEQVTLLQDRGSWAE